VIGLVIGTRPDCITKEILEYCKTLQNKGFYVVIEYGIESTKDETLKFINRGHNFEQSRRAIQETANYGIPVGAHMILGLPGETREDLLSHAEKISDLPLTMLKLHQLQLVKGTVMEKQYQEHKDWFHLYSVDEYIDLVIDFLEKLNPDIIVERFVSESPKSLLTAPDWGLKNFEFVAKLEKRLKVRDTWQGIFF